MSSVSSLIHGNPVCYSEFRVTACTLSSCCFVNRSARLILPSIWNRGTSVFPVVHSHILRMVITLLYTNNLSLIVMFLHQIRAIVDLYNRLSCLLGLKEPVSPRNQTQCIIIQQITHSWGLQHPSTWIKRLVLSKTNLLISTFFLHKPQLLLQTQHHQKNKLILSQMQIPHQKGHNIWESRSWTIWLAHYQKSSHPIPITSKRAQLISLEV